MCIRVRDLSHQQFCSDCQISAFICFPSPAVTDLPVSYKCLFPGFRHSLLLYQFRIFNVNRKLSICPALKNTTIVLKIHFISICPLYYHGITKQQELRDEYYERFCQDSQSIIDNVENVIVGKRSAVELAVISLICTAMSSSRTFRRRQDKPGISNCKIHKCVFPQDPVHAGHTSFRYNRFRFTIRRPGISNTGRAIMI